MIYLLIPAYIVVLSLVGIVGALLSDGLGVLWMCLFGIAFWAVLARR